MPLNQPPSQTCNAKYWRPGVCTLYFKYRCDGWSPVTANVFRFSSFLAEYYVFWSAFGTATGSKVLFPKRPHSIQLVVGFQYGFTEGLAIELMLSLVGFQFRVLDPKNLVAVLSVFVQFALMLGIESPRACLRDDDSS